MIEKMIGILPYAPLIRRRARAARRQRDWASDVFYRRRLCVREPGVAANWLQLGHALKELGFVEDAEDAYLRAANLDEQSIEIALTLAHFYKARLRWGAARDIFLRLLDHGKADRHTIEAELKTLTTLMQRTERFSSAPAPLTNDDSVHVFLSNPLNTGGGAAEMLDLLGQADYSYGYAMRGFIRALRATGTTYSVISNPEYVPHVSDRSTAAINIHLGFYPPERVRLLKGAYNIICFAWEFDRLRQPAEVVSYHAFSDQATMLDRADEIWVPSRHGTEAVRLSVSKPVRFVPSPIVGDTLAAARKAPPTRAAVTDLARGLETVRWQPLAVLARVQTAMNAESNRRASSLAAIIDRLPTDEEPLVFTTILNVHDFRKQLYPLLEGFCQFQKSCPRSVLLVKLSTPFRGKTPVNNLILGEQVLNPGELSRPLVSDRVWITDDRLSDDNLLDLYDLSAFYVCTSYAEGQNLPLLEAMGRGVVPLSVNHTAMADYVTPDGAVVIPSRRVPMGPRLSSRYGLFGLDTNDVTTSDVTTSLAQAAALDPADYAALSNGALTTVTRNYGVASFAETLSATTERLRGRFKVKA